jgi:hypothetical protein
VEKYPNLGGIYFPILQQNGSRQMIKISNGDHSSDLRFLAYLRQHDRQQGANA